MWAGPPKDLLPGIVGLELVLVQTDRQVVWIGEAEVYPEGVLLAVSLNGRQGAREGVERGPGTWRFGVQFSDGRKATSAGLGIFGRQGVTGVVASSGTGFAQRLGESPPPDGPLLSARGGRGNRQAWAQQYWLWPLPPPGELVIACEWPDLEIEFTTATVPADPLREAAKRARPLWPADVQHGN